MVEHYSLPISLANVALIKNRSLSFSLFFRGHIHTVCLLMDDQAIKGCKAARQLLYTIIIPARPNKQKNAASHNNSPRHRK